MNSYKVLSVVPGTWSALSNYYLLLLLDSSGAREVPQDSRHLGLVLLSLFCQGAKVQMSPPTRETVPEDNFILGFL